MLDFSARTGTQISKVVRIHTPQTHTRTHTQTHTRTHTQTHTHTHTRTRTRTHTPYSHSHSHSHSHSPLTPTLVFTLTPAFNPDPSLHPQGGNVGGNNWPLTGGKYNNWEVRIPGCGGVEREYVCMSMSMCVHVGE